MIINQSLVEELELIVREKDWKLLRSWFALYNNEEDRIDKVLLWGLFFLPHYLRDKSPEFHRDLVRRILSEENEFTACPRGFGKTTVAQVAISFLIANGSKRFIVLVEKSFREASEVLFAIADEFRENPMIRQVYGDLVKRGEEGELNEKNKDAQGDVFINGVRLRAKGFNTPIRGLKSKEWRPDLIIVDDVEEDSHINSEEQRRKYRENFVQGILPALDVGGSVKVTGTILHNDSLLKGLISQFNGKIYRAFDKEDPEKTLLWPSRWTFNRLMEKKSQMELEGKGSSKFYQEYLNECVDDSFRPFKWEWLQNFYTEEEIKFKTLNRYIAIDVADSKKEGADYTGVVVVDWDSENNWFIRFAKRYRVNITGLVDLIFDLWTVWEPLKVGVEKRALTDQLEPLLKLKRAETNEFPVVVELEHGGQRKEDRIRGALIGRFECKKIWFLKDSQDDQMILRGEIYDFPSAKNDDLHDSLAYISQLGSRPFGGESSQPTSVEDEFWAYKKSKMAKIKDRL